MANKSKLNMSSFGLENSCVGSSFGDVLAIGDFLIFGTFLFEMVELLVHPADGGLLKDLFIEASGDLHHSGFDIPFFESR